MRMAEELGFQAATNDDEAVQLYAAARRLKRHHRLRDLVLRGAVQGALDQVRV